MRDFRERVPSDQCSREQLNAPFEIILQFELMISVSESWYRVRDPDDQVNGDLADRERDDVSSIQLSAGTTYQRDRTRGH